MILDLPIELTEQVLLRLPVSDLVPLTALSSSFYDLIHNSHLIWTHHLRKRGFLGLSSDHDGSPNTLEKFRARVLHVRELDKHLSDLSETFLHSSIVEVDLEQDIIKSRILNPDYREITHLHLTSLINSPNKFTNLTARFYAHSLLIAHIQAGILQDLDRCLTEGNVFHGSLMVSRWVGACLFEPSVVHSVTPTDCVPVHDTVRDIVRQCRALIAPSASTEEVISVINRVLYLDFGLQKNVDNYYNFENNRIDKVLYQKKGIPITIAIIYYEIGSQLGLTLHLINFPRHFLLSFLNDSGITMYIDCFNNGNLLTRSQCLQLCPMSGIADKDDYFQSTSPVQVLSRLVRNAITFGQIVPVVQDRVFFTLNLYKLMSYLAPEDYDSAVHAINLSLNSQIMCKFLRRYSCIGPIIWDKYCRRVAQAEEDARQHLKVKMSKPEHVRFSIGSVMIHKRFNYTCVLYGWDERCEMSTDWQERMGIGQLEHQANQPYYKVLADDESERYVAQENLLETTRGIFIPHRHVGKYFELFDGERFVPNAALRTVYTYLDNG